MKRLFLVFCLLFSAINIAGADPFTQYLFRIFGGTEKEDTFTVQANTSTPTQACIGTGESSTRNYYLAINESTSYIVRLTTFPATGVQINNSARPVAKGKKLNTNNGFWEDDRAVYKSTHWVIIQGGGAANVAAYTADVTYTERSRKR